MTDRTLALRDAATVTPYYADAWLTLWQGDVREVLAELPDASVHMVCTSPPYWGLRDYGVDDQLGLEPTPEAYIESMVAVFREVKRVLRDDGTVWLNMGDSYANDAKWGGATGGKHVTALHGATGIGRQKVKTGLKPKDLVGMPWRLAFALQADGWYLRKRIVWCKPNPMPESVEDRPTSATEDLFLLSKNARYFYDAEAVRETSKGKTFHDLTGPGYAAPGQTPQTGSRSNGRDLGPKLVDAPDEVRAAASARMGRGAGFREVAGTQPATRNLRDWWVIPSEPYPGAHFATFPQKLVEPCIKAGTSERGVCPECGAPWVRETKRESAPPEVFTNRTRPSDGYVTGYRVGGEYKGGGQKLQAWRDEHPSATTSWRPTCKHDAKPVPAVVMDIFGGSGTVGLVAERLGRRSVLIELNPEYCGQIMQRIAEGRRDGTGPAVDLPLPAPEGSLWEATA